MSMNFEGREKVSYAFSDENILSDISLFTVILNNIIIQRNKLFLNKSKEDIAKMQDAVDYLNRYLDYDLKTIKDSVFPNLWRFGIKCSDTPLLYALNCLLYNGLCEALDFKPQRLKIGNKSYSSGIQFF